MSVPIISNMTDYQKIVNTVNNQAYQSLAMKIAKELKENEFETQLKEIIDNENT